MRTEIEGIIISETPYGDTSKIINVLTPNNGIVGIMIKGARTLKSPFCASTGNITLAKFYIKYNKDKLSYLNDISIINNFRRIKTNPVLIAYASYFIELIKELNKQNQENLYQLLKASLIKLDNGLNPKALKIILEIKILVNIGVEPNFTECTECGNKKITTISSYHGGALCSKCSHEIYQTDLLTPQIAEYFKTLNIEKIKELNIPARTIKELEIFLDDYLDRFTALYLGSRKFLKSIDK